MSANIEGYVIGNDIDIERDVPGISLSDPVAIAVLTIKTSPVDSDAQKILQKSITTTPVNGIGQIVQTGGTGNGDGTASLWFQITKAETLALGAAVRYYYDIRVFTAANKSYNAELDSTVDPPISVGSLLLEDSATDAIA